MAKKKRASPQERAAVKAAATAALLAGQGIMEIAKQYKLDASTVWRWKKKLPENELQRITDKSKEEFDSLIAAALRSILETLKVSADFIRSKQGIAWIREHSPTEFGTLVGILTDKGFRLLEAAEYAEAGVPEVDPLETSAGAADRSVQ